MIQLTDYEKNWIKLCKGRLQETYPFAGRWIDTLKPLFTEIYGWNPNEDHNYDNYLNCIFNKLLDIYLKIADDKSGNNNELRSIFSAAFYKSSYWREDDLPVERAISKLCGLIQGNRIIFDNGEQRYEL